MSDLQVHSEKQISHKDGDVEEIYHRGHRDHREKLLICHRHTQAYTDILPRDIAGQKLVKKLRCIFYRKTRKGSDGQLINYTYSSRILYKWSLGMKSFSPERSKATFVSNQQLYFQKPATRE